MKTLFVVAVLVACAAAQPYSGAPLEAEFSPTRVPGEYVVVFQENITDNDVNTHKVAVESLMSYHGDGANSIKHHYHSGSFRGYGAVMDDNLRDIVRSMDNVKYVECNQLYHTVDGITMDDFTADGFTADGYTADGYTADDNTMDDFTADGFTADGYTADGYTADDNTMDDFTADDFILDDSTADEEFYNTDEETSTCRAQTGAPWGLVRTTTVGRPATRTYRYKNNAGQGVVVYIIDTGIDRRHPDFGGRAFWGADFVANPSPRTDLNGHGTHVAGTVMANTWGIAKKAIAVDVRVLDQNGSGTTNAIIAAVNTVVRRHRRRRGRKSIINMSLGGGRSNAMNAAVNAAVNAGVHVVVAAGNSAKDACNVSPASAQKCVTVGASDQWDNFASFSNYGRCENIIAPGVRITSTWLNGRTNTISGTSMASPHVAGVMAKYLSRMPSSTTPARLRAVILRNASRNKVSRVPANTPNRLVFKRCR